MSVYDDINKALIVINSKEYKPNHRFSELSPVYRVTNEKINSNLYIDLLSNNKKALSVIGSGDQIINSVLLGTYNIDAFDISIFPKYYLDFKISAIKELSYIEYCNFFFGTYPYDEKNYKRIVNNMEGDSKIFWDELSKYKSSYILLDSNLFSFWNLDEKKARYLNPYLDKYAFYELKNKIDKLNMNYYNEDIYSLNSKLNSDYDFVNLSNVGMYADAYFKDENKLVSCNKFKNLVTNLRITNDGKVLNYLLGAELFTMSKLYRNKVFVGEEFSTTVFMNDVSGRKEGISVYKKRL